MIGNDLAPPIILSDTLPKQLPWKELDWLHDIKGKVYFALWLRAGVANLPNGYDYYFVTYHMENFDYEWVTQQAQKIDGKIIVLNDGKDYNAFDLYPNVEFHAFYSWHYQISQILNLWNGKIDRNPQYKVSAINNRITQSKLIVFTAIMEYLQDPLVKLGTWLEPRNIHYGEKTGEAVLDTLQDIFLNKYYGTEISVDEFDHTKNNQRHNSNPYNIFLTAAALHFSLESYHYSQMLDHIRPGPHLSEKTLKCLAGGTPFIPVGQFDIYGSLRKLGMQFDYGPLDLAFDQDPGNLTRLCKLVELVKDLTNYSIDNIIEFTHESTQHNLDHVISGDFSRVCVAHNENCANHLVSKLS